MKIKSIKIEKSKFFVDDFIINFDDKLNCIMGSRGTGKSTLLYFIKSILDEEGENDKNVYSVLKNNLDQGVIKLYIQDDNEKKYRLEKSLYDDPTAFLNSTEETVSLKSIRRLLNCDIYEAQRIEKIGLDCYDRLDLIDKMVEDKDIIISNIKKIQDELRQNAIDLKGEKSRLKVLLNKLLDYESVEKDLKDHISHKPKEITEKDNDKFKKEQNNEKLRREENKFIENQIEIIDKFKKYLNKLNSYCTDNISEINAFKEYLNKDIIDKVKNILLSYYNESSNQIIKLTEAANKSQIDISKNDESIKDLHSEQHTKYVELKRSFENFKNYYELFEKLSKKVQEKKEITVNIKKLKKTISEFTKERKSLLINLKTYQDKLFNIRLDKIQELNSLLKDEIRITLTRNGVTDEYFEMLKIALKGSGMKYSILGPKIIDNFSPSEFARIIFDNDIDNLKKIIGIDKERSNDLIDALKEKDELYEIEILNCPDLVIFNLKIDIYDKKEKITIGDYKPTEYLSTGQRCTAILPIIFAVTKNPLIIDQPEDNLDNEYIYKTIYKIIIENKIKRQLIFITHNPNIPVLSESENNIFLLYENQKAQINKDHGQGNVDYVANNIRNLLEGGAEAFERRKLLYDNINKTN